MAGRPQPQHATLRRAHRLSSRFCRYRPPFHSKGCEPAGGDPPSVLTRPNSIHGHGRPRGRWPEPWRTNISPRTRALPAWGEGGCRGGVRAPLPRTGVSRERSSASGGPRRAKDRRFTKNVVGRNRQGLMFHEERPGYTALQARRKTAAGRCPGRGEASRLAMPGPHSWPGTARGALSWRGAFEPVMPKNPPGSGTRCRGQPQRSDRYRVGSTRPQGLVW
jgi:hypothetical protein